MRLSRTGERYVQLLSVSHGGRNSVIGWHLRSERPGTTRVIEFGNMRPGRWRSPQILKMETLLSVSMDPELQRSLLLSIQARIQGGGGGRWVRRPPLGRRDPRVPSSQGQKEGTLVFLEWLFNTIQAKYGNKHLEKLQICVCVCQKSFIPIPYKIINPLAPPPPLTEILDPRLVYGCQIRRG